jgi:hypothetical protein
MVWYWLATCAQRTIAIALADRLVIAHTLVRFGIAATRKPTTWHPNGKQQQFIHGQRASRWVATHYEQRQHPTQQLVLVAFRMAYTTVSAGGGAGCW